VLAAAPSDAQVESSALNYKLATGPEVHDLRLVVGKSLISLVSLTRRPFDTPEIGPCDGITSASILQDPLHKSCAGDSNDSSRALRNIIDLAGLSEWILVASTQIFCTVSQEEYLPERGPGLLLVRQKWYNVPIKVRSAIHGAGQRESRRSESPQVIPKLRALLMICFRQ